MSSISVINYTLLADGDNTANMHFWTEWSQENAHIGLSTSL